MDKTIADALEDYNYGFYTSHDGDSHQVLVGTNCAICGKEFFHAKPKYQHLANNCCDICKAQTI